jgi:radical SAM protein with 4Fe4S-binding SPASM domain
MTVNANGKIVPCCFDKDIAYPTGDLATDHFNDIWQGTVYQQFRKSVLTNRKQHPICLNCTEGLKNSFL